MFEERALSPGSTDDMESLVSMAPGSSAIPRVTFNTPEKSEEEVSHRKLSKLTTKYNRKDLQRWLDLEEWIDAQLQELYQYQVGDLEVVPGFQTAAWQHGIMQALWANEMEQGALS